MVTPVNTSLLQPTKYSLSFLKLPQLTYYLQSVNLPGLSITDIPRPTPFVELYIPGEKLVYDMLNFTFLLDEDLRGWFELHDWMRGMTFPHDFGEHAELLRANKKKFGSASVYSDAVLTINDNANVPNLRIKFHEAFPIQLGSIQFDTTSTADQTMVGDCAIRFTYYDMDRVHT